MTRRRRALRQNPRRRDPRRYSPRRHGPGPHGVRSLGLDANGCPVEEWDLDGQKVIVHYDDIPESDVTTVHGLRVTTPARTVIDLAATLDRTTLDDLLDDFLTRQVLSLDELRARLSEPDMATRPGAVVLRRHPRVRPEGR